MRDLPIRELRERFGDSWTHIDWEASGEELSRMLTEQLGTRCKVRFEAAPGQRAGEVYTCIDTREFGGDPAGLKATQIFESFEWIRFNDYS